LNYSFSHFDLYVEIFYKKIRKIDYPQNKWLNINKYSNSQLPTVMKKILEIMM
jgi:adenine-specific DNA glycosylase